MVDIDALFFVIVNRGKANAVLRKAQECGAVGGTIFLGEGTVQSKLLEMIGLTEIHKEILMISASDELCARLHQVISEEFMLNKRNRGMAFSIPFKRWQSQTVGQKHRVLQEKISSPYLCIMTIVDKGRSKSCIKVAREAGAKGGTLIHGRGAGIPTDFYFPLVIEPQKDILMIITTKDEVSQIRGKIFTDLELAKAGNGIIFTLPVSQVSGLLENRSDESGEVMR